MTSLASGRRVIGSGGFMNPTTPYATNQAKGPLGGVTQQANPYQNPRLNAIINPTNKQAYFAAQGRRPAQGQATPNLGIGNQYLQQLMQRYMMPSPSYQNAQPQQGLLQANPYVGKQYKYAGSKQAPSAGAAGTTPAAPAVSGLPGGCPDGWVMMSDGAGGHYCARANYG